MKILFFVLITLLSALPKAEAKEIPTITQNLETRSLLDQAAAARSDGKPQAAIGFYKRAIEIEPGNFLLHRNLGILFYEVSDYTSAIQSLIQASRIKINDAYTLFFLGKSVFAIGETEESLTYLEAARDQLPDEAMIYSSLGDAYRKLLRHTDSENAYERALELNPQLSAPFEGLGHLFFNRHQYERAGENFREALKWDPKNADIWFNLAMALFYQNELGKAAEAMHRSLTHQPNNAEGFNGLGLIFQKAGQWKLAEKSFKKALEIDSSYSEAKENLDSIPWRRQEFATTKGFTSRGIPYTSRTTQKGPFKITATTPGFARSGPPTYRNDNNRPGYDPVSGYDPRTGYADPHAGDSFDSLTAIGNSIFGSLFKKD